MDMKEPEMNEQKTEELHPQILEEISGGLGQRVMNQGRLSRRIRCRTTEQSFRCRLTSAG